MGVFRNIRKWEGCLLDASCMLTGQSFEIGAQHFVSTLELERQMRQTRVHIRLVLGHVLHPFR